MAHAEYPGVLTIAEESTAWPGVSRPTYEGGLGFSVKWNMGWMNDTLRYAQRDPIHRTHHHGDLTFSLIYAFTENFALPFSHDEVVHGKGALLDQMPGDLWQKFAQPAAFVFLHVDSPWGRNCSSWVVRSASGRSGIATRRLTGRCSNGSTHGGIKKLVADLNQLYINEPALHECDFSGDGFEWIDCHNAADSTLVYVRRAKDPSDFVVVVCNMTPVVRHGFRVGCATSRLVR